MKTEIENKAVTCDKCGCKNINRYLVEKWDLAYCPICGENLKKQEEIKRC